jgi:hypothetical protein
MFDLRMDIIWQNNFLCIYAHENPAREYVHLFQNIFWICWPKYNALIPPWDLCSDTEILVITRKYSKDKIFEKERSLEEAYIHEEIERQFGEFLLLFTSEFYIFSCLKS